jgi:predicted metal-dependent hydrolase
MSICSSGSKVSLHNLLGVLVAHRFELFHLAMPNHSRDFYDLQAEAMPNWERPKLRL